MDPALRRRILRRRILQLGTLGGLGLDLTQVLRAEAARGKAGGRSAADACILIFLNGGPSHLDMWDMKPEAPAEIRGPFAPIATSNPAVQLSEHLPRLARWMHVGSLVRSAHHTVNNAHAAAVYTALTGHDRGDATVLVGASPHDYPAIGSVMAKLRPPSRAIVPFVNLPYITKEGAGGPPQPGLFGGILGRALDPFHVLKDPSQRSFSIPELTLAEDVAGERFAGRAELLRQVGGSADASPAPAAVDELRQRAIDLLRSPASQRAFRLDQEPSRVRDAYGKNIYGQSVLLARRLIEAGTRVVTVSWAPDANATWDTHGDNFGNLKNRLLPPFDAAISSLLVDLSDRGMLERTLVVAMGEFGRSPRVNGNAGRDHWNFCYSLLMAGGGIRPGVVHGASDRIGSRPKSDPVGPADVVATIYDRLGIDPMLEITDRLARPFALVPWGSPIQTLLG